MLKLKINSISKRRKMFKQIGQILQKQKVKKKKVVVNPRGKKPDVTNLKVSLKDDPQFDKLKK